MSTPVEYEKLQNRYRALEQAARTAVGELGAVKKLTETKAAPRLLGEAVDLVARRLEGAVTRGEQP